MKIHNKWLLPIFTIFFTISLGITTFAGTISWDDVPGNHNHSLLLNENITSTKDIYQPSIRGEYLSTGILSITNGQDGKIYIEVETLAHRGVDKIQHSVLLEQWDEESQDWFQVKFWEFEKTKEEEEGERMIMFTTDITVSGLTLSKFYRARGLHMVEFEGNVEAFATETHGVLLTKK